MARHVVSNVLLLVQCFTWLYGVQGFTVHHPSTLPRRFHRDCCHLAVIGDEGMHYQHSQQHQQQHHHQQHQQQQPAYPRVGSGGAGTIGSALRRRITVRVPSSSLCRRSLSGHTEDNPSSAPPRPPRQAADQVPTSFVAEAVKKVAPAVVLIETETTPDVSLDGSYGQQQPHQMARGQGSGFIYDGPRGLVLTNAHVVKGADLLTVTLTDGSKLEVRRGGVVIVSW